MQWRASARQRCSCCWGLPPARSHSVGGVAEHLDARAFSKSWRERPLCLDFSLCAGNPVKSLMNGRVMGREAESPPLPHPAASRRRLQDPRHCHASPLPFAWFPHCCFGLKHVWILRNATSWLRTPPQGARAHRWTPTYNLHNWPAFSVSASK